MLFFDKSSKAETETTRFDANDRPTIPIGSKNMTLVWKNISYAVPRKRNGSSFKDLFRNRDIEYIQLLQAVNGIARSGCLMAIMGPSGSGKTTLLAAISRRLKDTTTGDVLLNGEPVNQELMTRMSGFVPQEDLAVETLTVQEHMEFMARLKMDRRFRAAIRNRRIFMLLSELGLVKCSHSKLSALSGGERRRVSLAVQLLTEPNILFCDEPTTGLDSFSALAVVRTLREVAARGRVVICSLHQPASGLLDLFHEVLLLSAGRVAFQGSSSDATTFLDSLGFYCPPTFNNAEFYVSQLSIVRGKEADSLKKTARICDQFEKSVFGQRVAKAIAVACSEESIASTEPHAIFLEDPQPIVEYKKVSPLVQIEWLTWRSYVDCKRSVFHLALRFVLYMSIGVILSIPFTGVSANLDQSGVQNMQGLLYLVVTETVFTFNYGAFYTFPRELPLLLRDIASGLYHPAAYYISKVLILLPGMIVQPVLYSLMIYTVTGLQGGVPGFLAFVLPVILAAFAATAVGLLMSAAFESVDTASLISVPVDFFGLIFSGIYLHLGDLTPPLSWLKYLSQFYYGAEAISLTQWPQIDHIKCPSDPEEPCVSTGLEVLEKYGYKADRYLIDLAGLLAIFCVSHLAGFIAIRYRSRKQPVY